MVLGFSKNFFEIFDFLTENIPGFEFSELVGMKTIPDKEVYSFSYFDYLFDIFGFYQKA